MRWQRHENNLDMEKELKQFIIQVSAEAGEYLRSHFYTLKNLVTEDSGRVFTNTDLELGEILKKRILDEYPDHGLIMQGAEDVNPGADYVWIVDPLDGSGHFYRNIPIYTVNIALQYKGEVIFGTVNQPQTNQLFFAQKGQGAYLDGIKIQVSDQSDVGQAFVFIEMPEKKFNKQSNDLDSSMEKIGKLVEKTGQVESFRIGAFGQCLVAAGSFDAYIDFSGTSEELSQKGSRLILSEAGGEIIELSKPEDGLVQIMGTNKNLAKDLKHIIDGK